MGNTEEPYQKKFYSKYNFIELVNDINFGQIKVYRKKQLNFDYVMILEKFMSGQMIDRFTEQIKKIHHSHTLKDEPRLLRIFHYAISQGQIGTCDRPYVKLYIEYFNFTLKDLMNLHMQNFQSFTFEEIMHILNCTVQIYEFFKQLNTNYLTVRANCIFLSPEGYIRFSPIRIADFYQEEANCDCKSSCFDLTQEEMHFQKTERQFLIELKKLFSDIIALNNKSDHNFKRLYEIFAAINHARTVESVKKILVPTTIEGLALYKKVQETTDHSTNLDRNSKISESQASKNYSRKIYTATTKNHQDFF